jgi:hypothetical protein
LLEGDAAFDNQATKVCAVNAASHVVTSRNRQERAGVIDET